MLAERGARRSSAGCWRRWRGGLVAPRRKRAERRRGPLSERELVVLVPGADPEVARRAAKAVLNELESNLPGFVATVARSRHTGEPADVHRAGAEALLAANVAEARGPRRAVLRGDGQLPPAAARDGGGPARATGLLRRDDLRRWSPMTSSTRPSWSGPRDLPGRRRQRGRPLRRSSLHPPPHDPLPPGAGEGADFLDVSQPTAIMNASPWA